MPPRMLRHPAPYLAALLLPHCVLGLVLLAPTGSNFSADGLTAIQLSERDDVILEDSATWWAPANTTQEHPPPPLEDGDLTLERDTIKHRQRRRRKNRQQWDREQLVDQDMIESLAQDLLSKSQSIPPPEWPSSRTDEFIYSSGSSRQRRSTDQAVVNSHIDTSVKDSQLLLSQNPSFTQTQQFQSSSSSFSSSPSSSAAVAIRKAGKAVADANQIQGGPISFGNINTLEGPGRALSRRRRRARTMRRLKYHRLLRLNSMRSAAAPEPPVIVQRVEKINADVGVLVVVENSIYRQYLQANQNNHRVALGRIRRYYGMIFSMIHQRFQTIRDSSLSVAVTISGILILDNRSESSWMEELVDWSTMTRHGRASVHTDRALRRFSKWVKSRQDLPEYDHAMVFTAYRLSNKQGVGLGGMAYLNAICDTKSGNAVSIVGDRGDFQCVKVATHELAHSLGATHDGDKRNKACRPDRNFVMSPLTSHENHVLKNAFYFSPCSIRDMVHHLSKESSKCVKDKPAKYYEYDLQRLPPGRLYSADVQCQLIFGKKSQFCGEGALIDIMCGQLWCRDPGKENGCRTNSYLTALPGTQCGRGKTCHLGECRVDASSQQHRQRTRAPSTANVIPSIPQPNRPSFRIRGPRRVRRFRPRSRNGRKSRERRRRRRSRCTGDKNARYCEGLIKLNPGGCRRKAIRQYCCQTCRRLRSRGRR